MVLMLRLKTQLNVFIFLLIHICTILYHLVSRIAIWNLDLDSFQLHMTRVTQAHVPFSGRCSLLSHISRGERLTCLLTPVLGTEKAACIYAYHCHAACSLFYFQCSLKINQYLWDEHCIIASEVGDWPDSIACSILAQLSLILRLVM